MILTVMHTMSEAGKIRHRLRIVGIKLKGDNCPCVVHIINGKRKVIVPCDDPDAAHIGGALTTGGMNVTC